MQHYVVELEFSDFDIPALPGARNCTPESGVLWIYNGETINKKNLIGGFCNLNREGTVYSTTNVMTLVFATRWREVGNGRGFYAVYRGVQEMYRAHKSEYIFTFITRLPLSNGIIVFGLNF